MTATKTQISPRLPELVEEITKLSTAGASFHDIATKLQSKGSTAPEIQDAFVKALNYFRTMAEFNPEIERGRAYARLNLLFLSALKVQDFKACLSVQKEINKLLDLYNQPNADFIDVLNYAETD